MDRFIWKREAGLYETLVPRSGRSFISNVTSCPSLVRRLKHVDTLGGHHGGVTTLSFSQDGSLLLTAAEDCKLRLWSLSTGLTRCFDSGHTRFVNAARFFPDCGNSFIATASKDCQVRIIDLNRQATRPCHSHQKSVRALATLSQATVMSGGEDGTVRLWDVRVRNRHAHSDPANDQDSVLVEQRTERRGCSGLRVGVNGIGVNPMQPHMFVTGNEDPLLRMYDLRMIRKQPDISTPASSYSWIGCYMPGHMRRSLLSPPSFFSPWHRAQHVSGLTFTSCGRTIVASYGVENIYSFSVDGNMLSYGDVFKEEAPGRKASSGDGSPSDSGHKGSGGIRRERLRLMGVPLDLALEPPATVGQRHVGSWLGQDNFAGRSRPHRRPLWHRINDLVSGDRPTGGLSAVAHASWGAPGSNSSVPSEIARRSAARGTAPGEQDGATRLRATGTAASSSAAARLTHEKPSTGPSSRRANELLPDPCEPSTSTRITRGLSSQPRLGVGVGPVSAADSRSPVKCAFNRGTAPLAAQTRGFGRARASGGPGGAQDGDGSKSNAVELSGAPPIHDPGLLSDSNDADGQVRWRSCAAKRQRTMIGDSANERSSGRVESSEPLNVPQAKHMPTPMLYPASVSLMSARDSPMEIASEATQAALPTVEQAKTCDSGAAAPTAGVASVSGAAVSTAPMNSSLPPVTPDDTVAPTWAHFLWPGLNSGTPSTAPPARSPSPLASASPSPPPVPAPPSPQQPQGPHSQSQVLRQLTGISSFRPTGRLIPVMTQAGQEASPVAAANPPPSGSEAQSPILTDHDARGARSSAALQSRMRSLQESVRRMRQRQRIATDAPHIGQLLGDAPAAAHDRPLMAAHPSNDPPVLAQSEGEGGSHRQQLQLRPRLNRLVRGAHRPSEGESGGAPPSGSPSSRDAGEGMQQHAVPGALNHPSGAESGATRYGQVRGERGAASWHHTPMVQPAVSSLDRDGDELDDFVVRLLQHGAPEPAPEITTSNNTYLNCFRGHQNSNFHCLRDVITFGARDSFLASGSDDGRIFIWCMATGKLLNVIEGSEGVNCLQAHPSELTLASSFSNVVRIWRPEAEDMTQLSAEVLGHVPGSTSAGGRPGHQQRGRSEDAGWDLRDGMGSSGMHVDGHLGSLGDRSPGRLPAWLNLFQQVVRHAASVLDQRTSVSPPGERLSPGPAHGPPSESPAQRVRRRSLLLASAREAERRASLLQDPGQIGSGGGSGGGSAAGSGGSHRHRHQQQQQQHPTLRRSARFHLDSRQEGRDRPSEAGEGGDEDGEDADEDNHNHGDGGRRNARPCHFM